MSEQFAQLWHDLPAFLGGHLWLSLAALAVGLGISLPLGIVVSRRPRWAETVLALAGVIQTVPSLALLALMVLLLGGLIGFWPAFLALTLYSILPILANTIVGIRTVDRALTDAARGLGMSDWQVLLQVELPLAAPTIITGIRTATVLVIGTATLVTPVGGVSLGNYIFGGLESLNHAATIFGCVAAALLAIVLDQLIHVCEIAARRRRRRLAVAAALGLLLLLAAGLYTPVRQLVAGQGGRVLVAGGPFTEQHILCGVLQGQLGGAGFRADVRRGMSEGIQIEALRHSQVDCIVNYTGNIWSLMMKRTDFKGHAETLAEVSDYLRRQHSILCLGTLGFENAYALAIKQRDDVRSIADLRRLAAHRAGEGRRLRIGGDNQVFGRPEWRRVKESYQLGDAALETVAMDPTLMYDAVNSGMVDAIVAYTSDGRIKAYGLEILADPQQAFPPYDAILMLSPQAARNEALIEQLRPLVGAIAPELMREANRRVDVDGRPASRVAEWLLQQLHQRASFERAHTQNWRVGLTEFRRVCPEMPPASRRAAPAAGHWLPAPRRG